MLHHGAGDHTPHRKTNHVYCSYHRMQLKVSTDFFTSQLSQLADASISRLCSSNALERVEVSETMEKVEVALQFRQIILVASETMHQNGQCAGDVKSLTLQFNVVILTRNQKQRLPLLKFGVIFETDQQIGNFSFLSINELLGNPLLQFRGQLKFPCLHKLLDSSLLIETHLLHQSFGHGEADLDHSLEDGPDIVFYESRLFDYVLA